MCYRTPIVDQLDRLPVAGRRPPVTGPGLGESGHAVSLLICAISMVRPAGIEPATLGLEVRCSVQLSYGRLRHLPYIGTRTTERGLLPGYFRGLSEHKPLDCRVKMLRGEVAVALYHRQR